MHNRESARVRVIMISYNLYIEHQQERWLSSIYTSQIFAYDIITNIVDALLSLFWWKMQCNVWQQHAHLFFSQRCSLAAASDKLQILININLPVTNQGLSTHLIHYPSEHPCLLPVAEHLWVYLLYRQDVGSRGQTFSEILYDERHYCWGGWCY